MAAQDWVGYALAAMLLFSAGNVVLKMFVSKTDLSKFNPPIEVVAGALVAVAIIAFYVLSQSGLALSQQQLQLAGLFVVLALAGFLFMLQAVATGKIALVTAVLSLSTVAIAVISFFLLGDRFGDKEIAAMILAIASVIVLVI